MGPIWGRQDPGGPHVGPMNFAIWDSALHINNIAMKPIAELIINTQINPEKHEG